jgi:cytochrome c oxidase subunit 2
MGHSTPEWAFVVVVIALLIYVGAESWRVEHTLEFAPPNSETVRVIGQQWFWSFEHADGTKEVNELHLKTDIPYRFEMVSNDVIHDFAVPDFAILMDVIPGRVNTIWNVFDVPGEYLIHCREYCGQLHQDMRARLFVEPNDGSLPVATNGTAQQGAAESPLTSGTGTAGITAPGITGEVSQGTGTARLVEPGPLAQNTTTPPAPAGNNATNATGTANATSSAAAGVTLSIPSGAATPGNPAYDPAELSVKKGDVVNVVNNDNAIHTATSGNGPEDAGQAFDTSLIMVGASGTIDTSTIEAGEYPYFCTVHPFMKGTLTVTA